MSFIRWILSHIVLFSFIGVMVYAWVYWDELSARGTPVRQMITMAEHELNKYMGDGKPKLTRGERYRLRMEREAELAKKNVGSAASVSSVSTDLGKTDNEPPPKETWKDNAVEKTMASIGMNNESKTPVTTQNDRSLWIKARKSCVERNFEQCENLYTQLVSTDDGNFDAYGELGNVYFQQKKYKDAANAWFNTARILIDKGQAMRARSVMPLLQRLDAEKADDLKKMLDEKLSTL